MQIVMMVMKMQKQKTLHIQPGHFKKIKKRYSQDTVVFAIGAVSYSLIEILWRGYTHWTMMITGGI